MLSTLNIKNAGSIALATVVAFAGFAALTIAPASADEGTPLFDRGDADLYVREDGDPSCDGTADQSGPTADNECAFNSIQDAIDAAVGTSNTDIFIDDGTYNEQLVVSDATDASDIRLQGDASNPANVVVNGIASPTEFDSTNYPNYLALLYVGENADGFEVSGILFDGRGVNGEEDDVTFDDDYHFGIFVGGNGANAAQSDIVIENNEFRFMLEQIPPTTTNPVAPEELNGVAINLLRQGVTEGFEQVTISHNEISDIDTVGIRIASDNSGTYLVNSDVTVMGNTLDEIYTTEPTDEPKAAGNVYEEAFAGAISLIGLEDSTVSENEISDSEYIGIFASALKDGNNSIENNTISSTVLAGIAHWAEFSSEIETDEREDPNLEGNSVVELEQLNNVIIGDIVDYEDYLDLDFDQALDQYFTYYDDNGENFLTWILVGNAAATQREVGIRIAGDLVDSVQLDEDEQYSSRYDVAENGEGPVVIQTDGEGVYASQRALYNNNFTEYTAITQADLDNELYFTYYDNTNSYGAYSWILAGNPNNVDAEVDVEIGGVTVAEDVEIQDGEQLAWTFNVADGGEGPVKIISDQELYASQRTIWGDSFTEVPAIPEDRIGSTGYTP